VWAGIGIAIESLCLGMECNGSDERTDGRMDGWLDGRTYTYAGYAAYARGQDEVTLAACIKSGTVKTTTE